MPASNIYSVTEIIGKTLFAKKDVNLHSAASDSAPVVKSIKAGNPVGVVYSWTTDINGNVWWEMIDGDYNDDFVKHETGLFDINALTAQGAIDAGTKTQQEQDANKSTEDKIIDAGKKVILVSGSIYLGWQILKYFLDHHK